MDLLRQENKSNYWIKTMDTINSPEKTANAFRSLIDKDNVHLLLGTFSAENAQIGKHIAQIRGVPFIANAYDAELINESPSSYTAVLRQNPMQLGQLTALYFFYMMKKNRLAVISDVALIPSTQCALGFLGEGRLIGATMIEETYSSFERPADWQVSWSRLERAEPEVVFIAGDPSHYRDMLKIAREVLQIASIIVFQHMPMKEDLENHRELFDQTFVMLSFYSEKEEFVQSQFYQSYVKRFNEKPGFFSAQGHDEIMFLDEVMRSREHLPLNERFLNLEGYLAEQERYLTGFRGFLQDGYSFHSMDVLKIETESVEFLGSFWMEILSTGS